MTIKANGAAVLTRDTASAAEQSKGNRRAPEAPMAVVVSDRTAPTVLGLPNARAFVGFLAALGVTPVKVGRRWYARLDAILAAIDARTGATTARAWNEDELIERAARGTR